MHRIPRPAIVIALAILGWIAVLIVFPKPIPQDPAYHRFADQRELIPGVPRTLDVISNLAFVLAVIGAFVRRPGRSPSELVFYGGVIATALGSAWYHLSPSDHRLVADRLGMVIALMAFLALVIRDRLTASAESLWLVVLEIVGIGSIATWIVTGDLRLYGFVQFFPCAVTLALLILMRRGGRADRLLWMAVGLYGLAKLGELFDREVYEAIRLVSGHTLKHLFAAIGTWLVIQWMRTTEARRALITPV